MLILLGTLRIECVVGKNYRLQDIRLSKSVEARDQLPVASNRSVEGRCAAGFSQSLSAYSRLPELSILRASLARCKRDVSIRATRRMLLAIRTPRARGEGGRWGPHPSRRPEAVDNQTKWRIPGSNR